MVARHLRLYNAVSRACRRILGVVLILASIVQPALGDASDGARLILIDRAMYASISDPIDRKKAIDLMLEDIARLESDENSPGKLLTYIWYVDFGYLKQLPTYRPRHDNLAEAIKNLPTIAEMYSGRPRFPAGFDPEHLADAIQTVLRLSRLKRGYLDVHVFGQSWKLGTGSSSSRLLSDNMPTSCVFEALNIQKIIPRDVVLSLEIRPPDGFTEPSRGQIAALLSVLGNTPEPNDNLLFLGVKGPRCESQARTVQASSTQSVFVGWPDPNDPPKCAAIETARASSAALVNACIFLPRLPSAGIVDMRPTHLIARDNLQIATSLKLRVDASPTRQSISVQAGTSTVAANGQSVATGSLVGTYNGLLISEPEVNCANVQPQPLRATLGVIDRTQSARSIEISTTPFSCRSFDLPLGSLTFQ